MRNKILLLTVLSMIFLFTLPIGQTNSENIDVENSIIKYIRSTYNISDKLELNRINNSIFTNYTFFKVELFTRIPSVIHIIAISSDNKIYDLNEFNNFLKKENTVILNENKALQIAKLYIISQVNYFPDPLFLNKSADIPYKDDFKDPNKYEITKPSISKINDVFIITLYTWSEINGILTKWVIKIKNDKIAEVTWYVVDVTVGNYIGRFEGFAPSPGQSNHINLLKPSLQSLTLPAFPPANLSVNDTYIDIATNDTSTTVETAEIYIEGFDPNTDVNISIVLYDYPLSGSSSNINQTLQSFTVTTNSSGSNTSTFAPASDSHTGVGNIIAVQVNDTSINTTLYDDTNSYFVIEKVYSKKSQDGIANYKVYYFSANFGWNKTKADIFANDTVNAAVNAYNVQINEWNFTYPDPDNISYITISNGVHLDSIRFEEGPNYAYGSEAVCTCVFSGNNTNIGIQANLESALSPYSYPNQAGMLRSVVAHENFHNLQYGMMQWSVGNTLIEGTARFSETAIEQDANHQPNSLFYASGTNGVNCIMDNPDRSLSSFSYCYALYWGFVYQHDGGINTIRKILENASGAGSDDDVEIPRIVTNILNESGVEHKNYNESLDGFASAIFEKNFTWGTYNGSNVKDWGLYLNNVSRLQPTYTENNGSLSNSLYPWAIEYVNVSTQLFYSYDIEFYGDDSSVFTVKILFRNNTDFQEENMTLNSSMDDHSTIINASVWDEILLTAIRKGTSGSGAYNITILEVSLLITVESPLNKTHNTSDIDFNLTVYKALTNAWFRVDGLQNNTMVNDTMYHYYNLTYSNLEDGQHNVTFWVNDSGGNTNSTIVWFSIDAPPDGITNLENVSAGITWIYWNWSNPDDLDFNHTEVWLNGTFKENVTKPDNFYNATGLFANTSYEIQTRAVDNAGNINQTWVNDTGKTLAGNVAPSITTPSISPYPAFRVDDLNASTTYTDLNNDNGTVYFRWYRNNVSIFNNSFSSIAHNTEVSDLLASGNFSKWDNITIEVWASDGIENSTVKNSTITISNSPPVTPTLDIPPNNTNTSDNTSFFNWTQSTDADSDAITYGIEVDNNPDFSSIEQSNYTLTDNNYTATTLSDDTYYWRVKAITSDANSSYTNYRVLTVDTTPPNITSYTIYPKVVITGNNVTLNANASDNIQLYGIYVNITLPNGTAIFKQLPINYTTILTDTHSVTFFANDTIGNINTTEDYFMVKNSTDFNVTVIDYNQSGISTELTVYFPGTSEVINTSSFEGNLSTQLPDYLFDLEFKAYNNSVKVRLNSINISESKNKTIGIDKLVLSGYLVTYGINNTYNMSNATLTISYNNTNYTNEDYLEVWKCVNWNFTGQACLDNNWTQITGITPNEANKYFEINLSELSGFSIKQASYCGDGVKDSGEQCDGSDLGGETCISQGYTSGNLACTASCTFDTSGCTTAPSGPSGPAPAKKEIKIIDYPSEMTMNQSENKTFNVTVNNTGEVNLTQVNLTVTTDCANCEVNVTPDNISLLIGETQQFNTLISVSANQTPGVYALTIRVSSKEQAYKQISINLTVKEIVTCIPGEFKCSDDNLTLLECGVNGTWETKEVCEYGCLNGSCLLPQICNATEKRCIGNELQECSENGTAWITLEICDYGCDPEILECNLAMAIICNVTELRCLDNNLQECLNGTTWVTIEVCEYDCENNKCLQPGIDLLLILPLIIGMVAVILALIAIYYARKVSWKGKGKIKANIDQILRNPNLYLDKTVNIKGKITQSARTRTGTVEYTFEDKSGKILACGNPPVLEGKGKLIGIARMDEFGGIYIEIWELKKTLI